VIIKPKATLIDYSDNPEENVATAARLCYSKDGAERIREKFESGEVERLVKKILDLGHFSTMEHNFFSFHIVCSKVTSHQIVRQRVGASYSQRSQRYVEEDDFDYIIPDTIRGENKTKYMEFFNKSQELYREFREEGIPKEDARFIFPAIKTNLIASYNARSLYYLFRLRCCNRSQWEIRSIANQMLEQVKEIAPVLFSKAGADCEAKGICNEGELSCGKLEELQRKEK